MKKPGSPKWRIALLCVPLALFALQAQDLSEEPEQVCPPRMKAAEKFLNLSAEQKESLEKLRKAWSEEQQSFREAMMTKGEELKELMKDTKANAAKIEALRDGLFAMKLAHMQKSYDHRKAVSKVFTEDQLKKLKTLRSKARRFPRLAKRFFGRGFFHGRHQPFRQWAPRWQRERPFGRLWRWHRR